MSNMMRQTYSPKENAIYNGNLGTENFAYAEYFEAQKLAELSASPQFSAAMKSLMGSVTPVEIAKKTDYKFTLSAAMRKQGLQLKAAKEFKKKMWAGSLTPVEIMQHQQIQQLKGSMDSQVEHIRTIPLIPKIIGEVPDFYFLTEAFTSVPVEKLDARVPEMDGIGGTMQQGPGQRTIPDKTDYDEHNFKIKRNDIALLWTSESQIRSDFDIKNIDIRNARLTMKRMRDLQVLIECSKLPDNAALKIRDPTQANGSGFPNSANNVVEDLATIISNFTEARSAPLTHLMWNSIDFVLYQSSFHTTGFVPAPDYAGWGVVATPKIPGVTSVVSPMVPRGFCYGISKPNAFLGEGPFVTEMDRDAGIYSDVGYMHDFVQVLIGNNARYGEKIIIEGVTPGTEIASLSQAQKLVAPKATLANPS